LHTSVYPADTFTFGSSASSVLSKFLVCILVSSCIGPGERWVERVAARSHRVFAHFPFALLFFWYENSLTKR
ncbi:hypothetical protein TGAM01_v204452, partial [Trichoderma gamsii]